VVLHYAIGIMPLAFDWLDSTNTHLHAHLCLPPISITHTSMLKLIHTHARTHRSAHCIHPNSHLTRTITFSTEHTCKGVLDVYVRHVNGRS